MATIATMVKTARDCVRTQTIMSVEHSKDNHLGDVKEWE